MDKNNFGCKLKEVVMKKLLLILSLSFIMLFSSACINGFYDNKNNNQNNIRPGITQTVFELESIQNKSMLSGSEIYKKVAPSMVSIVNFGTNTRSEGSGIVMSEDGYIITNAHVIENAQTLKIYLYDNREFTAKPSEFWLDTYTDLGVIKINANNLTPAEFGDANEVDIGDDIYALGNPGGMEFKYSITKGIISYKYRPYSPIADSGFTINVLQVDAPINPGNSGGALVNVYGQVIGINSAKIVASGFESMGFSISINDALPIISELVNKGYIGGRPALGITYRLISSGIEILSINPQSDLINKGFKAGYVITKIGDVTINSTAAIKSALSGKRAGDTVKISYRTSITAGLVRVIDVVLMDAVYLN